MKNNIIEVYVAKDQFNRVQATLKVWRRRVLFESSGKREVVREIVSVSGADMGSQKFWTRGASIPESARSMGLSKGLMWRPA